MNIKYPQNLTEALVMALPNCMTMVLGMMTLNLWIYGALTLHNFLHALPLIFVTAFVLDWFVAGPVCVRAIRRGMNSRYMPLLRVGIMAGILTFLAPIIESGIVPPVHQYIVAFPRNYVAALILQIFVARHMGMGALSVFRARHAAISK